METVNDTQVTNISNLARIRAAAVVLGAVSKEELGGDEVAQALRLLGKAEKQLSKSLGAMDSEGA